MGRYKFLPVEIEDTPLNEACDAIRDRVKVPILFDYNALARREIDITTKVSLKPTKTFYRKIIDRLLYQLKLKCDLLVDEAELAKRKPKADLADPPRGYKRLYADHVLQAPLGCDFDFLRNEKP